MTYSPTDYPIVVGPLADEEGGGFVALIPDLTGCSGDGATPEEAIADAYSTAAAWIDTYLEKGREIPAPGSQAKQAGAKRRSEVAKLQEQIAELSAHELDFNSLVDRVEQLDKEISFLLEQTENQEQWARFAEISGVRSFQGELLLAAPLTKSRLRKLS